MGLVDSGFFRSAVGVLVDIVSPRWLMVNPKARIDTA